MDIQIGAVSRDISRFLLIPVGMALGSLPVCLLSQEWFALVPFVITVLSGGALSFLLYRLGHKSHDASLPQVFISVALGWAVVAIFGALPIWLTALSVGAEATPTLAYFQNGLNALFEGFSGFTSAGLTMVIQPSRLPVSLQWWRSLMQWVGGVGVIVLALALMEPTQSQYVLYQAEGRQTRIRLTIGRTVRRIWIIYTGYTVASVILFRIFGMTWWEALNHSMTAISTGGFSVTDGSMGAYSSAIKVTIILVMILGAISFNMHNQLLVRRQLLALWRDQQHFLLIVLLIVGSMLVAIEHYLTVGQFAWVDTVFQWVSALTTCGFSSQSIQFWSSGNKILLSIAMILGGAAGSTVGGLKLERVLALFESVVWRLRRISLSPRQMTLRHINGPPMKPEQASRQIEDATALTLLWIGCIVISVLVLLRLVPTEYSLSDVIFESASALGAAGLSVGITGPTQHWLGKCVLIFLMWMGRLEIIPVLVLLYAPWGYLLDSRRSWFG
ncbi:TrkH family potassium uptake protein [Oscillatoria sp. CS-180]|uniref:TrkH family potassium uptake protein n=1 Tax=Oscillatoria sp. CS-180 TaxID=3021720 RepID=UPI00232E276F|nr:TrkH family potassium uptake protein [Oscillatoria sp. CS-180]MDB9525778.1 TrkH family potassium uptake protein [Oscillatoria sp. CS-180]